jgi:hypothetical protein
MLLGQNVGTDMLSLASQLPDFDPQTDSFSDLPLSGFLNYMAATLVLSLIEGILIMQLVNGALAYAVSQSYLDKPVGILEAYGFGFDRMVNLVLAGVLVFFITLLLYIIPIGLFFGFVVFMGAAVGGAGDAGSGIAIAILLLIVLFLGLLAFILLAIVINMWFLFVTHAVVLEGRGPMSALGRSWRLISSSFWRILGAYLLLTVLVFLLTIIPTYAASTAISFFFGAVDEFAIQQALSILTSYVVQIFVLPINLITFTLLYYDTRVRKEGYDLHMLAQQYEMPADSSPAWVADKPDAFDSPEEPLP